MANPSKSAGHRLVDAAALSTAASKRARAAASRARFEAYDAGCKAGRERALAWRLEPRCPSGTLQLEAFAFFEQLSSAQDELQRQFARGAIVGFFFAVEDTEPGEIAAQAVIRSVMASAKRINVQRGFEQ
jgi:hypothetical protein